MIRLLLVDDHAATREPLAMMLEGQEDMTVAEAREALAGGLEVDVAVLDLGLPDGPGEDLIGPLLATNPRASALELTTFSDEARLARAVGVGAAGVLHKSSGVGEILDAVRRLHAGDRLVGSHEAAEAIRTVQERRSERARGEAALESLTPREREVLQVLAEGLSDKEIAERLHLSAGTVRTHVNSILAKTGLRSRMQALVFAVRHGVVDIG